MELSQFTDYSLRALIRAAVCEPGERTSAREIADAFGISHNHIVKVVHNLSKLGYLLTARGRGGGIALAMPAGDIGVGDVVRKTENLAIVECLSAGGGACCIAPACTLKRALAEARRAFLAVLDGYTIADLAKPRSPLRSLLGAGTPRATAATA
jgi:Rrf2 family nitric oxide-sensitive transcriptional repressor